MKRLARFELPKRLFKEKETATDTYAKFIAEPFETGYGHSIGNSLRRVLLSSIEGAAITSVKIEGVQHEFQSIDGVVEDVTNIVLNLKKILLKLHNRERIQLLLDLEKEGPITAGDIEENSNVSIINPEQIICTLDKKQRFFAEIEAKVGRGYCSAEENKMEDAAIRIIPIDSLFSPVRLVKYTVEDTRVGMITDYDKLILETWTDGRITPDEALKEGAFILLQHLKVFYDISHEEIEFESPTVEVSEEKNRLRDLLNMSVNELELSVRAANCLNNANISSVGQLVMMKESDMLKFRNFGKKSLNELKTILQKMGLWFGYEFDRRLLDHLGQEN